MKKSLFLLIVALMATTIVKADDVSKEQALLIAGQFAANPPAQQQLRRAVPAKPAEPAMAHVMRSKVSGKDNVYIVNLGNDQGFVVLSGEDRADDVLLGYCDHGSFSFDNAPVQMKDLLNSYSEQVDELRKTPASSTMTPRKAKADIGSIIVGPLLTTTWNQWSPYNNQCPAGCPTGCVPTAIAQVMNYWKWPKESKGRLFDPVTGQPTGEDFSGHVYDWDNMLDNYGYDYTHTNYDSYNDVQANAVSKLMADIGTAFKTGYGPSGSPTSFISAPLYNNFGYDPDIKQYSGATAAELLRYMKQDLDQLRPILYSGREMKTTTDGHALVCDGYTSNDYFHFNYGWGGSSDGWYKNALCPMFSQNSNILTGIFPIDGKRMKIGDIEYLLCKNGEAHIVLYMPNGKVTDAVVDIPDEVTDSEGNSYKVTRIWRNTFYGKGHFNKVVLGNNLKSIDRYAFVMSTIDTLIIGDGIEEIPDFAFQMTNLRSVTIGSSIKRIGKNAFELCFINNVVCKSPAFEIDERAFLTMGALTKNDVEWLSHVTKIGPMALYNTSTFAEVPHFDNLEEIEDKAFYGVSFPNHEYQGVTVSGRFHIPAKLRKIAPGAFDGSNFIIFSIDEANPYFSLRGKGIWRSMLYNKNQTSLVLALNPGAGTIGVKGEWDLSFPQTTVKLEPGSIRTGRGSTNITIPSTIIEMEGAFKDCEDLKQVISLNKLPPVISDTTFNDKIFISGRPTLRVLEGSEELYQKAPGWRRFWVRQITNPDSYQESDFAPPQDRPYDMVVHYTDESGRKSVSVPVGEVDNVKMGEDGSKLVVTRPGQEDLSIDMAQMDSITWTPGTVYDSGEVFDLNDSTLTAVGQYCTVTLAPTVIDKPAQLTIRNAVLTPRMAENVVRGVAVDISLSTGEHELTGTAKICIPFERRDDETLKTVYFNPETGEWEPVYSWYDEEQEAVVILTDHLSEYGVLSLREVHTPMVTIEKYDLGFYDVDASLAKLYNIVTKDNIDDASMKAWRDDYGFWQQVGIDGGWNALQACGFNNEAIGNACDYVGYLGTLLTVLDVARADLNRDDVSVVSNSLKAICGFVSGKMASAIGTCIMQTSMVGVAAIAILLEKFGTMVQARKRDLIRAAYRHYYSEAGKSTVWNSTRYKDGDLSHDYFDKERKYPNNQWRSKKDWHMYFKPAIEKGEIKPENFQMLIEQAVRMYCDRFWDDNYQARIDCYEWAKSQGLTSVLDAEDDPALRKQISDEYYAELMHGDITEVFQSLREDAEVAAGKRVEQAMKNLEKMMNTVMTLKLYDSTVEKGKKSKFAGYKLRFTDIPSDAADPSQWEAEIADDGTATLTFTLYALVKNKIKCSFTLVDYRGVDVKTYSYKIVNKWGKLTHKQDLATGGDEVEAPELKDLELDYDPMTVNNNFTMYGTWFTGTPDEMYEERPLFDDVSMGDEKLNGTLYLNNYTNRKARFQTEIEKFFKQHDFIIVDKYGNIQIGDNIVGKFEGDEGKGGFTISTIHPFEEQSIAEYLQHFNEGKDWDRNLLNGTIEHKIDCRFTLTRIPDSEEYAVSYTGQGTYSFKANIIGSIEGVDFDNLFSTQHVIADQIHTREVTQDGSVRLNYTTKLR